MRTRKLLVILLALVLALGMSATAFAADDDPAEEAEAISAELEGEDAVEEEAEDGDVDEEEAGDAFVIPVPDKVVLSTQKLMVDGEVVDVQPYNIDNANYFKLRDLAALLTGTESQFNVTYEAPNMIVTTGEEYEPIDGDLTIGEDNSATCVPSKQVLLVDGEQVDILVYNIGGNNYFQLRGLGDLIGFSVDYDDASRTMIVETEGYEASDEGDEEEGGEEGADDEEEGDETEE